MSKQEGEKRWVNLKELPNELLTELRKELQSGGQKASLILKELLKNSTKAKEKESGVNK